MSYTGGIMALYSWFGKNTTEQNKKTIRVNKNVLKASESAKYIENYTMWPTAKVKQGIEVILPVHDDVEDKLAKESNTQKSTLEEKFMPLESTLIVTK